MILLALTDGERSFHNEMKALVLDTLGQETFVGLTREESEWLAEDNRIWFQLRRSPHRSDEDRERHNDLSEKHEMARLRAIGLLSLSPKGNA